MKQFKKRNLRPLIRGLIINMKIFQLELHEATKKLQMAPQRPTEDLSGQKKQLDDERRKLEETKRQFDDQRKGVENKYRQVEEKERQLAELDKQLQKQKQQMDQLQASLQKVSFSISLNAFSNLYFEQFLTHLKPNLKTELFSILEC